MFRKITENKRQSGTRMVGPEGPTIRQITRGSEFWTTGQGRRIYSRPARSNTSKTTTTRPSPLLG
jgi:hypothetical protein